MRTQSIWKIEFVPADGGAAKTYLDYGDLMEGEPSLGSEQEALTQSAVSQIWSRSYGLGAVQRPASWSRQETHASPAAAREFCLYHGALLPYLRDGSLKYTIDGGGTWEIANAVIISASPEPVYGVPHATLTRYIARGGKTRPLSIIALFAGIIPDWINEAPEDINVSPDSL